VNHVSDLMTLEWNEPISLGSHVPIWKGMSQPWEKGGT